jgi:hypothetical protein
MDGQGTGDPQVGSFLSKAEMAAAAAAMCAATASETNLEFCNSNI